MRICSTCESKTDKGKADARGRFVCNTCYDAQEKYLVNRIIFHDDKPPTQEPAFNPEQRLEFLQYCDILFGGMPKAMLKQAKEFHEDKGYTWLGMAQALEYFYILKRNDIKKAKGRIGIIPHVYEEAQKFYNTQNYLNFKKAMKYYNATKDGPAQERTIIASDESSKRQQYEI